MERDARQNGTVLGEDEVVDDFCRLDCDRIAFNSYQQQQQQQHGSLHHWVSARVMLSTTSKAALRSKRIKIELFLSYQQKVIHDLTDNCQCYMCVKLV